MQPLFQRICCAVLFFSRSFWSLLLGRFNRSVFRLEETLAAKPPADLLHHIGDLSTGLSLPPTTKTTATCSAFSSLGLVYGLPPTAIRLSVSVSSSGWRSVLSVSSELSHRSLKTTATCLIFLCFGNLIFWPQMKNFLTVSWLPNWWSLFRLLLKKSLLNPIIEGKMNEAIVFFPKI